MSTTWIPKEPKFPGWFFIKFDYIVGKVLYASTCNGRDRTLELSSAGKYVLVMPVMDVQEWQFWRPEREEA